MPGSSPTPVTSVLDRLREKRPLVSVELRPPRAGMSSLDSMDRWIDMYHGIQRLARRDTIVFLTDNAVGESEEENLGHLTANLGSDVPPSHIVPFLTCKHTLEYCLLYAQRAASHGFEALTVLGGDQSVGRARCVEHAYELRGEIRRRVPSLNLGGWANPHRDPVEQVDFMLAEQYEAEFYLTQIVSHHTLDLVQRFLDEAHRRGVPQPGVFGVFYYRSANPKTLSRLGEFFPVPAEGLIKEFDEGLTPLEICLRTIHALREVGVNKVYVSNLGLARIDGHYREIIRALGD